MATIYNKLAAVDNHVILQSGANTNDRVRIVEVRRYTPEAGSDPLQRMVADLGESLLPDALGIAGRIEVYTSLYGSQRCASGFVAMRLQWSDWQLAG